MSIFKEVRRVLGLRDGSEDEQTGAHTDADTAAPRVAQQSFDSDAYATHLRANRAEKDRFFKNHPQSPLPPAQRNSFDGLDYYPPNPDLRLELTLDPAEPVETVTMQTTTDGEQVFERIGHASFEVEGEPARVAVYRSVADGELFVPFRDATSGDETYGAGRYLEPVAISEQTVLIDFNTAYNPFCAYNEEYSCPLPPIENWLKVPIRAGEKAYAG